MFEIFKSSKEAVEETKNEIADILKTLMDIKLGNISQEELEKRINEYVDEVSGYLGKMAKKAMQCGLMDQARCWRYFDMCWSSGNQQHIDDIMIAILKVADMKEKIHLKEVGLDSDFVNMLKSKLKKELDKEGDE